jgi:uncharacterized protein (UPF0335 family)
MEIRSSEEVRESVESFSKAYLALMLEKKELDNSIKELKQEYKEEGVPVAIVTKALNLIKSEKKKSDSEIHEQDIIKEWLETNKEIDDSIGLLTAK